MNTAHVQRLLIDLGFLFNKTDEADTGQSSVWQCVDTDGIPLMSDRLLGPLVWKVADSLGGIS